MSRTSSLLPQYQFSFAKLSIYSTLTQGRFEALRSPPVHAYSVNLKFHRTLECAGIVEEALPASWILQHVTESPACKLLLLDTNIPERELRTVAHACWQKHIIVVVDPVSVFKSTRCGSQSLLLPHAAPLEVPCEYKIAHVYSRYTFLLLHCAFISLQQSNCWCRVLA